MIGTITGNASFSSRIKSIFLWFLYAFSCLSEEGRPLGPRERILFFVKHHVILLLSLLSLTSPSFGFLFLKALSVLHRYPLIPLFSALLFFNNSEI